MPASFGPRVWLSWMTTLILRLVFLFREESAKAGTSFLFVSTSDDQKNILTLCRNTEATTDEERSNLEGILVYYHLRERGGMYPCVYSGRHVAQRRADQPVPVQQINRSST